MSKRICYFIIDHFILLTTQIEAVKLKIKRRICFRRNLILATLMLGPAGSACYQLVVALVTFNKHSNGFYAGLNQARLPFFC